VSLNSAKWNGRMKPTFREPSLSLSTGIWHLLMAWEDFIEFSLPESFKSYSIIFVDVLVKGEMQRCPIAQLRTALWTLARLRALRSSWQWRSRSMSCAVWCCVFHRNVGILPHHYMSSYPRRSRGNPAHFEIRRMWGVNFTLQSHYPRGRGPRYLLDTRLGGSSGHGQR